MLLGKLLTRTLIPRAWHLPAPVSCRPASLPTVKIHRPGLRLPRGKVHGLVLLMLLLANGGSFFLLGLKVYCQRSNSESTEKSLQPGPSFSKLKPDRFDLPVTQDAQKPQAENPVWEVAPLPLGLMDQVDPLAPEADSILVLSRTRESPRGESPMKRNWKILELATAFALAVTPALYAGGEDKSDLKAIVSQLDAMNKGIKKAFGDLADDIQKIQSTLSTVQGEHLTQSGELGKLAKKIEAIQSKVAQLESEVKNLKGQVRPDSLAGIDDIRSRLGNIEDRLSKMQSEKRVALSPPAMGRIVLVNNHSDLLNFVINGQSHTVWPRSTMTLDQNAGAFTYEVLSPVWGRLAYKTPMLSPHETFTIIAQ
jgi:hypothetical protein